MNAAHQTVEAVARESYGRLLAWLASRCRSIAMAEDALGDALASALTSWPRYGVPAKPEAWLLTVARRRLIDQRRRQLTRHNAEAALRHDVQLRLHREALEASESPFRDRLPERRLELMFACAHPDVPEQMRAPLMLQTVLGLSAHQIAAALLVAPATVGQRLVRVKRRVATAGIPFDVPTADALPDRLRYVLDAVYAAYGTSWETEPALDDAHRGLAGEALWLAGLLVRLLPDAAEAKGLYALLCLCESRRAARRAPDGAYVPLEQQDCSLWDHDLIREGETALRLAARQQVPGIYQTEAAIHSVHAHRATSGRTDWTAIHFTYGVLVRQYPSLGASIGYAASCGRIGDAAAGIDVLDSLDRDATREHQPYWAVRAWLLRLDGRERDADDAYGRAIGLSDDPAVRAWLTAQRAAAGTA